MADNDCNDGSGSDNGSGLGWLGLAAGLGAFGRGGIFGGTGNSSSTSAQSNAANSSTGSGSAYSGGVQSGGEVRPLAKAVIYTSLVALPLGFLALILNRHDPKLPETPHAQAVHQNIIAPKAKTAHPQKSTEAHTTAPTTSAEKKTPAHATGPVLMEAFSFTGASGACTLPAGTAVSIDTKTDRGTTYVTVPKATQICPGVINQYEGVGVPTSIIGTNAKKTETKSEPKTSDTQARMPTRTYGQTTIRTSRIKLG